MVDFKLSDLTKQVLTVKELLSKLDLYDYSNAVKKYGKNQWSDIGESKFIESLLLDLPQESIILDGRLDNWYILKGKDQMLALSKFVSGCLELHDLYFRSQTYSGCTWEDLSLTAKQKINNSLFTVYVINNDADENVRFGLYMLFSPSSSYRQMSDYRSLLFPKYHVFKKWLKDILPNKGLANNLIPKLELTILHVFLYFKSVGDTKYHYLYDANLEYACNEVLRSLTYKELDDYYDSFDLQNILNDPSMFSLLCGYKAKMKSEAFIFANFSGVSNLKENFESLWDDINVSLRKQDITLDTIYDMVSKIDSLVVKRKK